MKQRVSVFIDGFNVYHRLDEYQKKTNKNLKWLDYRLLFTHHLSENQELNEIHFFTAIDTQRSSEVRQRHENYLGALKATGISVYRGSFKYKPMNCRQCGATWNKPEEKETDVRLACSILEAAQANTFDECWLVTSDQDLKPLIQAFTRMFPEKRLVALIPPKWGKDRGTGKLTGYDTIASTYYKKLGIHGLQLGFNLCEQSQLPDVVTDSRHRQFANPYKGVRTIQQA